MAALSGLRRVVAESASVPTAAVLASIYMYARLQAAGGQKLAAPTPEDGRSVRSGLATSGLARRMMRFKMRDGTSVRCRIVDAGGVLSVHVDRDYDLPVDWSHVRTIVDLGAHVGTFTLWAAKRALKARCLAVEPNPGTYELLVRNVRDNGLDGRVRTVNAAVGPRGGTGSLELVEHSLGTRLARSGAGSVATAVVTLDALLDEAEMPDVDVMKMDVEGMEYDVFANLAPERLQRVRALACEYHPEPGHDVDELVRRLEGAGFRVWRPSAALGVLQATRGSAAG